jgi:prepilin-type N-terminal cleavage/methylation domain-containing protein
MSRLRGFTLVEMLVVLGIIGVLVALLLPAVMAAVNRGRVTRMGTEIAQLNDAIEAYKSKMGDYPPTFRDANAVMLHIRRCYPKISATELGNVFSQLNPPVLQTAAMLDEGESLVFWLSGTRNNPQYPLSPGTGSAPVKYYDFPEARLSDPDGNGFPSFRPEYAKDTYYLYLDSRAYQLLAGYNTTNDTYDLINDPETAAYAEFPPTGGIRPTAADPIVRPYWSEIPVPGSTAMQPIPQRFQPMNASKFQIICAGTDGDFGYIDNAGVWATEVKGFPSGAYYNRGDRDNLTNFSGGRRLDDHIP